MRRRPEEYLPDFTERAEVAYQRLSPVDRSSVDAVINDIQNFGLRSRAILRMRGPNNIRIARASITLRILFQYDDGLFTILDIVTRNQLGRLVQLYRWNEG